jgi:hypothetical protein
MPTGPCRRLFQRDPSRKAERRLSGRQGFSSGVSWEYAPSGLPPASGASCAPAELTPLLTGAPPPDGDPSRRCKSPSGDEPRAATEHGHRLPMTRRRTNDWGRRGEAANGNRCSPGFHRPPTDHCRRGSTNERPRPSRSGPLSRTTRIITPPVSKGAAVAETVAGLRITRSAASIGRLAMMLQVNHHDSSSRTGGGGLHRRKIMTVAAGWLSSRATSIPPSG